MSDNPCFHCGLPVPNHVHCTEHVDGLERQFCCNGCLAVSQFIRGAGLDKFYQYRDQFQTSDVASAATPLEAADFAVYNTPALQEEFVTRLPNGHLQATLFIDGIHCAACTWLIEEYVGNQACVSRVNVNSTSHRCLLEWDGQQPLSTLMEAFAAIGYQPKPALNSDQSKRLHDENRTALLRLGVAGFAMMQVGMFAVALYAGALQDMAPEWQRLFRWVSALIATPVVLFSAQDFFRTAFYALRAKRLVMDVPVALAIGGAYLASCWATITNSGEVYFDSVAMFTFLLLLGRYLELRVRHKNEAAINQLHHLLPPYAYRVDADNKTHAVLLHQLNTGDHVFVKEGEAIPADGVVLEGDALVDESMLTGEAKPVTKMLGAQVSAGTLAINGSLLVAVQAAGKATRLSAIQQLMTDALHQKPLQASRADRIAAYFVAGVLLSAAIVAWAWYTIDPAKAFWVTLSVLVVTCPCAFSLATPVSLTAALHRLRQLGLLVTKAHVVEALSQVDVVVFDKTGTLTSGDMRIQQLTLADNAAHNREKVLAIVAALEQGSNHPLASLFREYAKDHLRATELQYVRAAGVSGVVDGITYRVGTLVFVSEMLDHNLKSDLAKEFLSENISITENTSPTATNSTKVWLGSENGVIACIDIQDSVRVEAREVISRLLARNLDVELLSGDQLEPVASVARQLGIERYSAAMSPEQKLARVQALQTEGKRVLMVGDGLNDLPVLSGADVSIAMSSATDLAQVQADSVLLQNNLQVVPLALDCAAFCQRIIKQNISWAVGYNVAALPLAAMGFIPPYLAALGMSLSSLIVVLNATRIFRFGKTAVKQLPLNAYPVVESQVQCIK